MIFIAEITAYNLTTNAVEVLRFCNGQGYVDSVADKFYEPRIEQPAVLSREIFSNGELGGSSNDTIGELTLHNKDGGLDSLTGYSFDGRQLIIKAGNQNSALSTFITVLKATILQARFEIDRVSISIRDRKTEFDKPIQTNLYGGTNSLPAGVDGVSDLKGSHKPKLYGRVANISPMLVNTSKLIYQVNDGAVTEIVSVMDKGAYLGRGADYADLTDLQNNEPTAGQFRVLKSGCFIRVGSNPAGAITCTAWESSTVESNTAAQVIYRILMAAGLTNSDLVLSDFSTLDSQNAGGVGIYINSEQTISDVINQVASSVGAWWGFDNLGRFRIARLDLPTGSPHIDLAYEYINAIDREQLSINGNPAPVYKITINCDKNYTVQDNSSLAGIVPADRRTWLAQETRTAVVEDSTIKTKHLLAQDITYDSLLVGQQYAIPEAARRLNILKSETHILRITVSIDASLLDSVDLGAIIRITHPRFNLSSGKIYRIIGIQPDFQRNLFVLRCWG